MYLLVALLTKLKFQIEMSIEFFKNLFIVQIYKFIFYFKPQFTVLLYESKIIFTYSSSNRLLDSLLMYSNAKIYLNQFLVRSLKLYNIKWNGNELHLYILTYFIHSILYIIKGLLTSSKCRNRYGNFGFVDCNLVVDAPERWEKVV